MKLSPADKTALLALGAVAVGFLIAVLFGLVNGFPK